MDFIKGLFTRQLEKGIDAAPSYSFLNSSGSSAGKSVNERTALSSSVVYACVRILSNSISSLPIHLYKRNDDRSRERLENHMLELLVNDTPNPMMTSADFLGAMQFHLLLYNTAYAEIIRNAFGEPVELWPLTPKNMTLDILNGEYFYKYTSSDSVSTLIKQSDVLVVNGMTKNGMTGVSPIESAANVIGLSLAAEEHAGKAMANGTSLTGALKTDGILTEEGARRLISDWKRAYGSSTNAGKVCLLQNGVNFEAFTQDLDKLQLLETRKFQVRDVARIFGVPLHMLADPERQSFSSNEQQALDFVTHTLRPWLVKWEKALARSFLTKEERQYMYFEFSTDALLRGDINTRYTAYQVGIQNGWLSADEIRVKENMTPIPGEVGNQYLLPMNMESAEAKKLKEQGASESHEDSSETPKGIPSTKSASERLLDPVERLISARMNQILECERTAMTNIVEKATDIDDFNSRIVKFAKNHKKYVRHHLEDFVSINALEDDAINARFEVNLRPIHRILEDKDLDNQQKLQQLTTFIKEL